MKWWSRKSKTGLWALVAALGCGGSAGEGSQLGGETNWLATCNASSDCSVGQCLCGVCTIACQTNESCTDGPPDSSCAVGNELPLRCGAGPSIGLCLTPDSSVGAAPSGGPSQLDTALELLLRDLEAQPAEAQGFTRYLSIANSPGARDTLPEGECGGLPCSGPDTQVRARGRSALIRMTNSLSQLPVPTVPVRIDVDGLYYRIDLRAYGWERPISVDGVAFADGWEAIVARASLALEYRGPAADRLMQLSGSSIPWLFGNDFVASAGTGNTYYELLGVPATLPELQSQLGESSQELPQRAAFESSGHSYNARVVERRVLADGRKVWQALDFGTGDRGSAVFRDPFAVAPDETELIFQLPNGLNGFFLADDQGQRLTESRLRYIVIDPAQPDGVQRTGAGCLSCHNQGFIHVIDEMRDAWSSPAVLPGAEQAAVLAAYPPAAFFTQAVDEDSAEQVAALERTGITPRTPDAVSRVYFDFTVGLVTRAIAAEELLTSQESLANISGLLPRPLSPLQSESGSVARAVFVGAYRDVMCKLHATAQNQPVGCR